MAFEKHFFKVPFSSSARASSPYAIFYVVVPEKTFNQLIYLLLFRKFIWHNHQKKVINPSRAGDL